MAILIVIIFILGYIAIAFENVIHIDKAASALVAGVLCWTVYILSGDTATVLAQLNQQLSDSSAILFFLIGAMTIVNLIDAHDGFSIVYQQINAKTYPRLLWMVSLITFFLSAFLNNLTTVIVMVTIVNKIVTDAKKKLYFAGIIVIAANAGGVWSPIGDVTTTMLWIGGQISTYIIMFKLFMPALFCIIVPLIFASRKVAGIPEYGNNLQSDNSLMQYEKNLIFVLSVGILLLVPMFKTVTGLPPYMAILLGMALLWIVTGLLHKNKDKRSKYTLSVSHALKTIDIPSILFFLGILLAVGALEATGQLHHLAMAMNNYFSEKKIIVVIIGVVSSIVDNVPLVAAAMGMYPLSAFPVDHSFWLFLSYCAGTGGSLLIIGSAAGIAAMGVSQVNFGWYLRKMSWLALIGFMSGIAIFILQESLM